MGRAFDRGGSYAKYLGAALKADEDQQAENGPLSCLLYSALQSVHASAGVQQLWCVMSDVPAELPPQCPERLRSLLAGRELLWLDTALGNREQQAPHVGQRTEARSKLQHLLQPHVQRVRVLDMHTWHVLPRASMLQVRADSPSCAAVQACFADTGAPQLA